MTAMLAALMSGASMTTPSDQAVPGRTSWAARSS
jgi:hypothetical protein